MPKLITFIMMMIFMLVQASANQYEKDIFQTSEGELAITFIGHGTLMMEFDGKVIHIDPVAMFGDYTTLPKADLILITHEHGDHLDAKTLDVLKKSDTKIVLTKTCNDSYTGTDVMKNGDSKVFGKIKAEAVPAYNIEHVRAPGQPYHPKGNGNGYVLTFGDTKVYVAGDTEDIPEMANLKDIDIAFLPMNLPYTMSPEMCAKAAKMFKPKVLYPYHFGETNTDELIQLLKDEPGIEVRIKKLG